MSKMSLFLATLLIVPACDSTDATKQAKTDKAKTAEKKDPAAKAQAQPEPEKLQAPEKDPAQAAKKVEDRVLARSGLGVGGKFKAFDIVNCESGEKYCQVCRFGGNPKLMAVGTSDDEAFRKDLKDLDAIAQKYGDDIKAFAVITDITDGKATTPQDVKAAQDKAKALKTELGLSMPVVVPAQQEDGGPNETWNGYYNITQSRTVMFADGTNKVAYSGVGGEDWSKLNQAIESVVGNKAG